MCIKLCRVFESVCVHCLEWSKDVHHIHLNMGLLTPTTLLKPPTSETHAVDSFLQDLQKALSEAKEALTVAKPPTIVRILFEEACNEICKG
jgi:hypothetical protein